MHVLSFWWLKYACEFYSQDTTDFLFCLSMMNEESLLTGERFHALAYECVSYISRPRGTSVK